MRPEFGLGTWSATEGPERHGGPQGPTLGRKSMSLFIKLAVILAAAAGVGMPAAAQYYPNRNVIIIVPFGPGGSADVYARFLGQHLSESLKRSFVIENRPGAGAVIGTDEVAKAAPDGYTLLMMSNTHTTN